MRNKSSTSGDKVTPPDIKKRLYFVVTLACIAGAIIIGRAAQLQLIGDSRLSRLSNRQFQSKILVRPRRGNILDRNGEALAVNAEIDSLAASPKHIENKTKVARALAKVTGVPVAKLKKRLKGNREFAWIKRHIESKDLKRLKKVGLTRPDGELIDGLWIVKETRRVYPQGKTGSHLLGFVNLDLDGIEGIELKMNEHLRGKLGSVKAFKDALGRPSFIDATEVGSVENGKHLALTIDVRLQYAAEQALEKSIITTKSQSGTVIVMDALSGEILAMANRPTFDPNERRSKAAHRRNRAITDGFEPGSTIKAILAAAAYKNGWQASKLVWGEGGRFKVGRKVISESDRDKKYGWMTLDRMLQKSSNVGAAKVALELGRSKYTQVLKQFGFGEKTGIEFPGELAGWIPKRKKIDQLTLANLGFGQGLFATPLQVTRAYATLLNGGYLVSPTLIKSPVSKQEKPKKILPEPVVDHVVRGLLMATQEEGTGSLAVVPGYKIAGKTGTSQWVEPGQRGYSKKNYISTFAGFALGVEKKLVVFTKLHSPKGVYYATYTAAPLFRDVMDSVIRRYRFPRTERTLAQNTDKITISQSSIVRFRPAHELEIVESGEDEKLKIKMPNLKGFSGREVMQLFEGYPVQIRAEGFGFVIKQFPEPGSQMVEGAKVSIELSDVRPKKHSDKK